MKRGDKCTVEWHYGHTDTTAVMKIVRVAKNTLCKSGTAVWVDGLSWYVCSSLVKIISKKKPLNLKENGQTENI